MSNPIDRVKRNQIEAGAIDVDTENVPNVSSQSTREVEFTAPGVEPTASSVEDAVGFGQVAQPQLQQGQVQSFVNPAVTDFVNQTSLPTQTFVRPDWDSINTNIERQTFSGQVPRLRQPSLNFSLPEPRRNAITESIIPNPLGQNRTRTATGLLDRVLPPGVRNNNLLDRLVNTLIGFTPLNGLNLALNLTGQEFGEYGTGVLGGLFYGLDFISNTSRGAVLDLLANTLAGVQTIRDRGGFNVFNPEFRRDFDQLRQLYDANPEGDFYESYLMRAILGDDLSFFNFRQSADGTYNPLGVLGGDADDFYTEIEEYRAWAESTSREEAGAWERFRRRPVLQRLPQAFGALGLELLTDPFAVPGLAAIATRLTTRRTTSRAIQQIQPPAGVVIPSGQGQIPGYVTLPNGRQTRLPDGFTTNARPRIEAPQGDAGLGYTFAEGVRSRLRQGMTMEQAIDDISNNIANPFVREQFRVINTPNFNSPTYLTRNPGVSPRWNDIASNPRMTPAQFPRRRSPQVRRAIVNNTANVVPPGTANSNIDRIIDAMPGRVGDELNVAAATFGSIVDDVPVANTTSIPTFLSNVGDTLEPINNVRFTRTSQNFVTIERLGVVNQDEYLPLLTSLSNELDARMRVRLPDHPLPRRTHTEMYEAMGWTRNGNYMESPVRTTPVPQRPANIVESVAENTPRVPGEYSSRVVANWQRTQTQPRLDSLQVADAADNLMMAYGDFPFGQVSRRNAQEYFITQSKIQEAESLSNVSRISLRQALESAPPGSRIRLDPSRNQDVVQRFLDEGFVIRRLDDDTLATIDDLFRNPERIKEDYVVEYYRRLSQSEIDELPEQLRPRTEPTPPPVADEVAEPTERIMQVVEDLPERPTVRELNQGNVVDLSSRRQRQSLSDLQVATGNEDILPKAQFSFGHVVRPTQNRFTVFPNDELLSDVGRRQLREAIQSAPEDARIALEPPASSEVLRAYQDEGFAIVRKSDGTVATVDELYDDLNEVNYPIGESQFEVIYDPTRQQVSNIRNVEEIVPTPVVNNVVEEVAPVVDDVVPTPSPTSVVDDVADVAEEFNIAGDTVYIEQHPGASEEYWLRLRSQDSYLSPDTSGELSFATPRFKTKQAAIEWIQNNQETLAQRIENYQNSQQVANSVFDLLEPENLEQAAVADLLEPDIVNNPAALDEVRTEVPDTFIPYQPTRDELLQVQEYQAAQVRTESLLSEHSDIAYQLDQIRNLDAEAFYDELLAAGDELETFNIDEVTEWLRESPDYDVLVELYNEMVNEPNTRNVLRYISQLEFAVKAQMSDIADELTEAIDIMVRQEDALREMTNVSNQRYIDDLIEQGNRQTDELVQEIGQPSSNPCA